MQSKSKNPKTLELSIHQSIGGLDEIRRRTRYLRVAGVFVIVDHQLVEIRIRTIQSCSGVL